MNKRTNERRKEREREGEAKIRFFSFLFSHMYDAVQQKKNEKSVRIILLKLIPLLFWC